MSSTDIDKNAPELALPQANSRGISILEECADYGTTSKAISC